MSVLYSQADMYSKINKFLHFFQYRPMTMKIKLLMANEMLGRLSINFLGAAREAKKDMKKRYLHTAYEARYPKAFGGVALIDNADNLRTC
jgi:hypothetical protein